MCRHFRTSLPEALAMPITEAMQWLETLREVRERERDAR
jgi:hypothetical protein